MQVLGLRYGPARWHDWALPDRGPGPRSRWTWTSHRSSAIGTRSVTPNTLALAITQSGETADTLAATRLAKELGAKVACVCNVTGSTQVRESDQVLADPCGPRNRCGFHQGVHGPSHRHHLALGHPHRPGERHPKRRPRQGTIDRDCASCAAKIEHHAIRAHARAR